MSPSPLDKAAEVERDPARFGAWVENACLAFACNAAQHVSYWREEPLEVDAVIDGTWGRWVLEVKTGGVEPADLRGLLEFTRRWPEFRPLLVTDAAGLRLGERTGVPAIHWRDFLWDGPEARTTSAHFSPGE